MERKEETFGKFAFAPANVHFYHFYSISKENWEHDENNEKMKVGSSCILKNQNVVQYKVKIVSVFLKVFNSRRQISI